jgi:FMN-binding protein
MRAEFLLLPAAAVTVAIPAHATVYLTIEQAQALVFPGGHFTPDFRTLSDAQAAAIERDSDVTVRHRQLRVWRASTGGWFIADDVVGKHDFIPFALGLDQSGRIAGIEILEYRESYGYEVRDPRWRAQFTDKQHGAALKLNGDIQNISGATLSSRHITDGVKRLLSTYALVLAASPR